MTEDVGIAFQPSAVRGFMCMSDSHATTMKIHDALDGFILQMKANGRCVHTLGQYRRHVSLLASWLTPQDDLRQIDHQVIARFLASPAAILCAANGKPRKTTSGNALRGSIKGFFAYLAGAGILDRDPSRLVRRARCGQPMPIR